MNVPFLKDVEQAHLNLPREVGELVDREDPAMRPLTIHYGLVPLIGKIEPASGGTDGVEVTDHVGDGHVWRRQFLDIALFAMEPPERCRDALFRDELLARAADRSVRVVVDFAAVDDWDFLVEESSQASEHPRFGLAAEPQENKP